MDLERVADAIARELDPMVEAGVLPGYCAAVRQGPDHITVCGGVADLETRPPVTADSAFRIASLTKPVAALVTMQQVQAGLGALDDPVSRWLPELADVRVLTSPTAERDDTEPLAAPITLWHLLTMTASWGIDYRPTTTAKAMAAARIAPGPRAPDCSPEQFLAALAPIPLNFQPGAGWAYHTCSDVLAILLDALPVAAPWNWSSRACGSHSGSPRSGIRLLRPSPSSSTTPRPSAGSLRAPAVARPQQASSSRWVPA